MYVVPKIKQQQKRLLLHLEHKLSTRKKKFGNSMNMHYVYIK